MRIDAPLLMFLAGYRCRSALTDQRLVSMDDSRFDRLARTLTAAGSRRRALAVALGGVLGPVLSASFPEDAAARKKCPPCKKRTKQGKCKKKKPNGAACPGGTCQAAGAAAATTAVGRAGRVARGRSVKGAAASTATSPWAPRAPKARRARAPQASAAASTQPARVATRPVATILQTAV